MNKLPDKGNVSEWHRLMLQWEIALTSYQAAQDAYGVLGNLEGYSEEREAAEQQALAELKAIKQKIDLVIKENSLRRKPNADFLVVGLIEKAADGSSKVSEYTSTRAPADDKLKIKPRRGK
jgi:hypothetical protein